MKISCFLPVRSGSERILNKNTKDFAGISGGLLSIKLNQLIDCENFEEVVLSTDDAKAIEIAENINKNSVRTIRIVERPKYLALSKTSLSDLIMYAGDICKFDHILWTHTTSPFINGEKYHEVIKHFENLSSEYDSLMTGFALQSFLWNIKKGDIINRGDSNEKWPRTQDLEKLYEIDNGIFIVDRKQYLEGNRVGKNPYIYELDKISKLDIDDEIDFEIAELLFSNDIK